MEQLLQHLKNILLLTIGLWNADLSKSEKGFYAMSFTLSIFAAIAVQKNTRDMKASQKNGNNNTGNSGKSNMQ